ncbi:hypothetical protein [Glutamicibacter nicotianae]|uniref:hypothetical protein n=1 Tax=Glutamicibacter nicotianae TaxID=37929 RepID=UPI00167F62FE|nr:hypothetical protein [Glutamicibacter nicotianae]
MNTNISQWLESKTGDTKRQMAIKLGHTPSTFNRNIETAEVIIAVCRAYGINPVEGLIAAGIIEAFEVAQAATESSLAEVPETALLEEVLRRAAGREDVSNVRKLQLVDEDPDYSNMSVEDARNYGLAAKEEDQNIGRDESPHEP